MWFEALKVESFPLHRSTKCVWQSTVPLVLSTMKWRNGESKQSEPSRPRPDRNSESKYCKQRHQISKRRSIVTPSSISHSLILKQRESVPPFQSTKRGWNQASPDDVLVSSSGMEDAPIPMYPLHTAVAVSGERIDQQRTTRVLLLREKMKELHKKASKLVCPLLFLFL